MILNDNEKRELGQRILQLFSELSTSHDTYNAKDYKKGVMDDATSILKEISFLLHNIGERRDISVRSGKNLINTFDIALKHDFLLSLVDDDFYDYLDDIEPEIKKRDWVDSGFGSSGNLKSESTKYFNRVLSERN
jgi:hypothetical protein